MQKNTNVQTNLINLVAKKKRKEQNQMFIEKLKKNPPQLIVNSCTLLKRCLKEDLQVGQQLIYFHQIKDQDLMWKTQA